MSKVDLSITIDKDLKEKAKKISEEESRSISSLIEYSLKKYFEEREG